VSNPERHAFGRRARRTVQRAKQRANGARLRATPTDSRRQSLQVNGPSGHVQRRRNTQKIWYCYSAKGFYTYDWRVGGGPYRRLSSPTVPISIDRLPDQLQAVARLAVFPVDFADESEITIEYLLTG